MSLKGTEIGWSRHGERRGRSPAKGGIPAAEYDSLYREFNPVKFDADAWVRIAREAGMKYLVFTTKHHDGFVNFDSKLTDYKITSSESPFGRDIVAELSEACRRGGLRLGFYYSQPDWHHADYRKENHDRYIAYLHGQVEELLTRYGKVDIFWFDGLGTKPEYWDAAALLEKMRRLQPHLIINNRCGLPADFDTPEQRIGKFHTDRPWETCMAIIRLDLDGPDKAFDGDGNSRRATDAGTSAAWLEVDLGAPRRFSRAVILEAYGGGSHGTNCRNFPRGSGKLSIAGKGSVRGPICASNRSRRNVSGSISSRRRRDPRSGNSSSSGKPQRCKNTLA